MLAAQFVLVTPVIVALTDSAVRSVPAAASEAARALGATEYQVRTALLKEARGGALAAVMTGLGRALAEVGAVMLVGGNILGRTRVLTTAILLETRQGNFGNALALGAILVSLSVLVNATARAMSAGFARWEAGSR
jgi:tungstate transport system permease protein